MQWSMIVERCRGVRPASCVLAAALTALVGATSVRAEITPRTFLVSIGTTTGSGSADLEAFGPGFGDLLVTDMIRLRESERRFADCDMAILEWRRRDDVIRERELISSGVVDPASARNRGPLPEPQALIEGTLTQNGHFVDWSITMRDRASGTVLATSTGSVGEDDLMDQSERVATEMLEASCPPGWDASGGGTMVKVTGHVARLNAPFQLNGDFPGGRAVFDYAPGNAAGGTVTYSLAGSGVTGSGSGSFAIVDAGNGVYRIEQTTRGCVDGLPNSCRTNSETITLAPAAP